MMESLMMGGLSFLMMFVYLLIPLAPIIYIFIKWRSYRDAGPVDPRLGLKVILYYFKTLGYHALLVGFVLLISQSMDGRFGRQAKISLAFLISGGIVYGIHRYLIANKTNTTDFPQTERIYIGFNLLITGIAGMASLITLAITLFEGSGSRIAMPASFSLVYVTAWAAQTYLMFKQSETNAPPSKDKLADALQ